MKLPKNRLVLNIIRKSFVLSYLAGSLSMGSPAALADDMTFEPEGQFQLEARAGACWQEEGFASEWEYQKQITDWQNEAVPFPGPLDAYSAYRIYKQEARMAQDFLRNDKKVHCYMGCRMTQEANFATAQWAGWEKERRDLSDCNANSHFEVMDYTATVVGAHLGTQTQGRDACLKVCDRDF
jgi:hypothetical protein